MYFIESGRVTLVHKGTHTHIKELDRNGVFGEISFFSGCPRTTTIIARDFTEVFSISKEDFYHLALKISTPAVYLFD